MYDLSLVKSEPNKEQIKRWITPERETTIRNCIVSAFNEYRTKYGALRHKHTPRTSASIIHDLIVWNIKDQFDNYPQTKCLIKQNLFLLIIGNGDVIIRFKKFNKKLFTHNIPTQQSFDFSHQMTLFKPSVNLNAGYQLDGLDLKVYITCPIDMKRNSWIWELTVVPAAPVLQLHKQASGSGRQITGKGIKEPVENGERKS